MLNKFDELRIKGEVLSALYEHLYDEYTSTIFSRDDANDELQQISQDSYQYSVAERVANEYAYRATAIKSIMDKLDKLI